MVGLGIFRMGTEDNTNMYLLTNYDGQYKCSIYDEANGFILNKHHHYAEKTI